MKWHPIPGYPRYAASKNGEILSVKRGVVRRQCLQRDDRLFVSLYLGDGKRKQAAVHRLIALTFLGSPPTQDHTMVNHKNGDHHDNRSRNLEWATRRENEDHAVRFGLKASGDRHGFNTKPECRPRGVRHGRAKLTEEDVTEIREARKVGATLVALAERFNVSKSLIGQIAAGEVWTHLALATGEE